MSRRDGRDPPEIYRFMKGDVLGVATTPAGADPADEAVENSAQAPGPIVGVVADSAADSGEGPVEARGGGSGFDRLAIHEERAARPFRVSGVSASRLRILIPGVPERSVAVRGKRVTCRRLGCGLGERGRPPIGRDRREPQ